MAPDSNKAKDSAASIFQILDSKPKIDSSSDAGITLPSITGDIDFEHVSFKYPTRPDVQIFRDICLKIPFGKVITKPPPLSLCLKIELFSPKLNNLRLCLHI
jgi:ATP-binding cassette subfamily B (MDR/TAP) protein 1